MEKQFQQNGYQDRIATIGGTFDTLHTGHKEYIRLAFEYADRVLIYVSSDEYANRRKNYRVRSYQFRVKRLTNFIREIGCENRYEIRCLHRLGNLETDYLENDDLKDKICMAIVSPAYYKFFLRINLDRVAQGMKSFLILVKFRTRDQNNNDLSSHVIRHSLIKNLDAYTAMDEGSDIADV